MGAYRDCLIVFVPLILAVTLVPAQIATPAPPGKSAEQVFRNIQVFRNTPAPDLLPAMQFMSASLGVSCDFCHVERAFEKDDKEAKRTARKMIQMMAAIDQQNFAGERKVTCYSCHRGSVKPVASPVLNDDQAGPGGRNRADIHVPSADDVIGRYVQALGGKQAIESVSSRVETGIVTYGERQFPIEIFDQSPTTRATFVHLPNGDNVTLSVGDQGWLLVPGRAAQQMSASELDAANQEADLQYPLRLRALFDDLNVQVLEKSATKSSFHILSGSRKGSVAAEFYFDQQTGLLRRTVRYLETPVGRLPVQIDYDDYREFEGTKVAFRQVVSRSNGSFSIQIDRVQQNVPIDASKFARPNDQQETAGPK